MYDKSPAAFGEALKGLHAGFDLVTHERLFGAVPDDIRLQSLAFEDGGEIPRRYTADGERLSPPLMWRDLPTGTEAMVLIVEDPDAPSLDPLVHLLAWDLPPDLTPIPEGMFRSPTHDAVGDAGRNAFMAAAYLPPSPPPGSGRHHYVFQLFALAKRLNFARPPSLAAVTSAMAGHVLAKGVLTGTYKRSRPAQVTA